MQSSQHACTMLRCAIVSLLAVVVASCGSAAPSDLLLPHSTSMSDSDSGLGDNGEAGAPDATVVPVVEASVEDVSVRKEASRCGPGSCPNGCCDDNDRCQQGTDDTVCGAGGVACESCTDMGETCSEGICTMPMDAATEAGCDPMTCPMGKCFGFTSRPCCNLAGACSCTQFNLCP